MLVSYLVSYDGFFVDHPGSLRGCQNTWYIKLLHLKFVKKVRVWFWENKRISVESDKRKALWC